MTFRERMVVAILLLVARMFADDTAIAHDIKTIANHISVHGKDPA